MSPSAEQKMYFLMLNLGQSFTQIAKADLDEEMSRMTYRDLQGDHTGFTGFETAKCYNDGTVYVESYYFDS